MGFAVGADEITWWGASEPPRSVQRISPCVLTTDNSFTGPAVSRLRRSATICSSPQPLTPRSANASSTATARPICTSILPRVQLAATETSASPCFCSHAENQSTGPAVTRMPSTAASSL